MGASSDVVVQDLLLPGGMDGVETTRRIREHAPSVRVVALTASLDVAAPAGKAGSDFAVQRLPSGAR